MSLADRYRGILGRIDHPDGVAGGLEGLFRRGKREQMLAGRDADGDPFAPLAPATLRHRDGAGPPLAPHLEASRVVADYAVTVATGPGRLVVEGSWPGFPQVRFHQSGTRKMPRRDPGGFRAEDRAGALRMLSEHLHGPGR